MITDLNLWIQQILDGSVQGHHLVAFWLAFIASMGTFIGGLLVIIITIKREDNEKEIKMKKI